MIFALSSIPGNRLPDGHLRAFSAYAHFAEYFILSLLVTRAAFALKPGIFFWQVFLSGIFLVMAFALLDEIHQTFVPDRFFEAKDLAADFTGALFGIFLYPKRKEAR